jgi:hypothetical protein
LHIDDKESLEFRKERLKCGAVYTSGSKAIYYLTKLADLNEILEAASLATKFGKIPFKWYKILGLLSV